MNDLFPWECGMMSRGKMSHPIIAAQLIFNSAVFFSANLLKPGT
ncbi:MAG: hypothetical protein Q8O64_21125 [Sideroxyarcus sp.]|nr:hypothetical protein [Sideroxyarcus sp.]